MLFRRYSIAFSPPATALAWYPSLTSMGSAPEWSMCACESTTASIARGSNPSARFAANESRRRPWTSPQSSRIELWVVETTCREPVTVPAAPKN